MNSPTICGNLWVISAPSGAGKTSLVRALRDRHPEVQLSISYTTRPPRPGEIDGVHYHFVERDVFERMVAAGEFVEYARVFENAYGTAERQLRQTLARGADVILEIDWQGARQVRARFPDATTIFILPPSRAALAERLQRRGQDSAEIIARRMAAARDELSHYEEYDYLIVNDRFDQALAALECILCAQRQRRTQQVHQLAALLAELLAE